MMKLSRFFLVTLLLINATLLFAGPSARMGNSNKNTKSFTFRVYDIDGKEYRESDFQTDIILLNFGTPYSEAFAKEKILMDEFIKQNPDLKISYVPILIGKLDEIKTFINKISYDYKIYYDQGGQFAKEMQISVVPTTFVVNSNGTVILKYSGIIDFEELKKNILYFQNNLGGGTNGI